METWQIIEKRWTKMHQEIQGTDAINFFFAHNDILDLIDKVKRLHAELDKANRFINELTDGQGWGQESEAK